MKKKIFLCIIILIILILAVYFILANIPFRERPSYTYDPQKALEYAYQYVNKRNPDFPNFEYNCVNYVSQCLVAGGIEMDAPSNVSKTTNTKISMVHDRWYCYSFEQDPYKPISYHLSVSFSRVKDFVFYWSKVAKVPYHTIQNTKENLETLKNEIKLGDVVILNSKTPHCVIIVKIDESGIYYNSNTLDRLEYPLANASKDVYTSLSYFNF